MRFLPRVARLTLCDKGKSSAMWEDLGVESLLLHRQMNQERWLGQTIGYFSGAKVCLQVLGSSAAYVKEKVAVKTSIGSEV